MRMQGRRVIWVVGGVLLSLWLGATTMDGLAQRLGPPSDQTAAPVPPIETATPGPDLRPAPRYGPNWIPPEPEGPPGSASLAAPLLPASPVQPAPRPAPKPALLPAPTRGVSAPPANAPGPPAAVPTPSLPREVAPAAAP